MKLYYKVSPILMIVGFVALAAGVFMSMSNYQTGAYILAGLGLIVYIVGRIGMHFAPKKSEEKDAGVEDNEI